MHVNLSPAWQLLKDEKIYSWLLDALKRKTGQHRPGQGRWAARLAERFDKG